MKNFKSMNLPNCKKPCNNCPFRKDALKGWLGSKRMESILQSSSFTCHKTNKELQCAGHMLIKKEENEFYLLANKLGYDLQLKGEDLIFETEEDCIAHHAFFEEIH